MLRVKNCFCCCSLKYGFLTFAVISLLFRVCLVVSLTFIDVEAYVTPPKHTVRASDIHVVNAVRAFMPGFGSMAGWYGVTSGFLILAIYGIFQIHTPLYPYIVVLIIEIIFFILSSIILAITLTPWILINMFIVGVINTYAIICLLSLYQTFKEYKRNRPQSAYDNMPTKTV